MPELPEVETVARLIRPVVEGRRVRGVEVDWVRTLGGDEPAIFEERVVGARIVRVWRRAKQIVMDLERRGRPAGHLLVHLRMTGRLHGRPKAQAPGPFRRVSLVLDRGTLDFDDVRKFGRFLYREDPESVLAGLGPEPLGEEFTADWLLAALRGRRRVLKPLLLDQSFVAGLGNIYVDEALHRSRLHPEQRSDRVRPARARELWAAIRETLAAAIEREGSSFDTFYWTPEGQRGSYQHQFQVYGRQGKPCKRCGTTIKRLVVAQRGTHLCPRCQPRPRPRQRSRRDG